MSWPIYAALSFIVWWITLFAVLPFGLRTQDDEHDVTLGTVPSAPRGPHMRRAVLWTTLIAALLMATVYGVTEGLGFGMESLPQIIPALGS